MVHAIIRGTAPAAIVDRHGNVRPMRLCDRVVATIVRRRARNVAAEVRL